MTIEIKVSGNDAAETVAQFLGLAGYLGASHQLPVAVAVTTPQVLTTTLSADADDTDEGAAPVAAGTVDAEGLPFDDRIHAKAAVPFKADGTWKRRKNISDELYNSVRAELKARVAPAAPVVDVAVAETPPPPAVIAEPAQPLTINNTVSVIADVPPAPAPAPVTPVPSAPAPAPVTGKTHADLKCALTKVLGAINTALPGKAAPLLMSLMASYGKDVKSIDQVPADKVDDCYNLMQRMAADPANAEAISAGLM